MLCYGARVGLYTYLIGLKWATFGGRGTFGIGRSIFNVLLNRKHSIGVNIIEVKKVYYSLRYATTLGIRRVISISYPTLSCLLGSSSSMVT